jgi:hypothetical protein
MSIETMRWFKAALPTSEIIVMIDHKDDDINTTKAETCALLFKHQVIPFLTKLFDNMDGIIQRPETAYNSKGI